MDITELHLAVEMENLPAVRDLLDQGHDVHEEYDGMSLLQHAVDVEIDGHVQTGEALHVDMTAYLLARGADPLRFSQRADLGSAEQMANRRGHWLAVTLIEEWKKQHPVPGPSTSSTGQGGPGH